MMENPIKNKQYRRQSVGRDLVIAFLIITLPLLLNVHNYISSDLTSFSFLGFTYHLQGYNSVSNLFFYFFNSLVKFLYIFIWFITCKNRWYKAIIALLILSFYWIVLFFNREFSFINDEIRFHRFLKELATGVLLTMFFLPLFSLLRKKFNTYYVLNQVDEKLQDDKVINSGLNQNYQFFFYAIIIIVISYFTLTQLLYFLRDSPNFDNSPIGFYPTKTRLFFILIGRITPILYLSLWLISCRYWWHHALVIPVSVYIVQVYTALQVNVNDLDKGEYLYITPILLMVIGVLYFIRQNILQKIEKLSVLEDVELRIEKLKNKKKSNNL